MPERRGHLKVFLGMAAGVGKTYRMLQEGRAAQETGRDVVVGLLETHGRAETLAQAEGLEVLPRRRVTYRDTTLEEMDLPALLRRAPDLALIDELAHTNAPGLEHAKRYADIEEVLAAGIDVLSTVNVQHLESLNDTVSELSGVRVRETIPDAILKRADEIVVVDLTPEALLDRLRAGKVYPAERIQPALNGFFRIESLGALRETALRQVAEEIGARRIEVEAPLGTRDVAVAEAARVAVGEQLMALVRPVPSAQRLIRRAWRSAQRLGADLDVLWVAKPGETTDHDEETERSLGALRQLCSVLGATLLVEEGDDVVETVARIVGERGITYLLIGESTRRRNRGLRFWRQPLAQRLMLAAPGVDVRIVADRSRGTEAVR
jgi:two-component system, OmpR family, sensor histidine kinase KdpD